MDTFVNDGSYTKFVAVLVLALLTVGSAVLLGLVLIANLQVNNAVLISLGSILGSGVTYFSKASGVVDGANIASNAVASVTGPIQDALNATPAQPVQVNKPSGVTVTTSNVG